MKKSLTFVVVLAFAVLTNISSAFANGTFSVSEKKAALTILVQQVDRNMISELYLSEMQYIYLKDLNKTYKAELSSAASALYNNSIIATEAKASELNNKYFAALSEILTPQQITAYVAKQVQAQESAK
ncbi:hypothetical protein ACXYMU_17210 [Pontibacter sp. CAU 1760]